MTTNDSTSLLRRAVDVPFRAQTYRNLLYLGLAFPLGICYFVLFVTGLSLGVGLLIVWVGLPILLLTLVGAAAAAGIEVTLARELVGVEAELPSVLREATVGDRVVLPGDGFLDAVRTLVTAPTTWTSVLLVLAKFAFGIAAFVALTTVLAVSTGLTAAPLLYDNPGVQVGLVGSADVGSYTLGPVVIETLPAALGVSVLGVLSLFVGLHLLNLLARIHATYTALLLGIGSDDTTSR